VAVGWRRLYNVELHIWFASPNVIRVMKSRRMRWAGNVACMGEMRNAYSILVGKPEGKRRLGRHRCRWEDIRMDLRETGWEDVDWIRVDEDRASGGLL
jgi:hypothetical protein